VRREREGGRSDAAVRSQWTIDLGDVRTFTDLSVSVPDVAFAWHVRVEASDDGSRYHVIETEAALFDQTWNGERVRKTDVRFDAPVTARYLRLTGRAASDSRLLELEGASVTLRRRLKGDAWSLNVAAQLVDSPDRPRAGVSRYRLSASSLLPFDEVEVLADDATFARQARLVEEIGTAGKPREDRLGEGRIFRLRASDQIVAGEDARFRTRNGSGGALFLDIDNAASPALRGLRVRLHGSRMRLLFPVSSKTLTLYYGNEGTRTPAYDLESLRPRIAQALGTTGAALSGEEVNPLFRREPPLRFAASLGASLDPGPWRHERAIAPIREEDVYTITLTAEDLTVSRPDLADLRVVNEANRQVPFLIDRNFTEERIPLRVLKGRSSSSHRSRYELTPEGTKAGDREPPLSGIELDIAEPFFERQARLLHTRSEFQREAAFSLTLARRPPATGRLRIATSAPFGPLSLEVDDGDNASLDVRSATAIIRVPRIVFKSAPGELHLLLGYAASDAPRYDLAGLRGELLAYSAVRASALALTENKGGKGRWFPSFQGAPRGTLVWGAIIAAIIVLLGLTLRTIKSA
ncbi:MAG: DUF3999 family protein, partial [Vicinamibacteria bacterium]|nr:DUF3999 family protein [Vicinamibacteria bacterium]